MEIIEGNKLAGLCDYSFGDHHVAWDKSLTGEFKVANYSNAEFLVKCKEFEGKVMTLFIDNIRLYPREIKVEGKYAQNDAAFLSYLMQTNNLLGLCALFPNNKFIIFTSHEDTPIDNQIKVPDNVLGIYAVNALYNDEKIHPFPIGLQRKMSDGDFRLDLMKARLESDKHVEPTKLLYINCGIERNKEREPLRDFKTNDWCTTRFDKDSKYFPHSKYLDFLDELQDHKFVICPKGHGYETHRIWETLYMRRVPVMLDDPYFRKLLEGFPVLYVEKWEDVTRELLISVLASALYKGVQEMDLNKLDLNIWYSTALHSSTK